MPRKGVRHAELFLGVEISAMYLQFATLHKCFDSILISSALPACGFWWLPHIFHKFLGILHYLSLPFPLFFLIYCVPLYEARCNDIIFVRRHVWHYIGCIFGMVKHYYRCWARSWRCGMLLSLPGAGVAWLWYLLILLPGHLIWCLKNTLSYKSFSVVLPAKIFPFLNT